MKRGSTSHKNMIRRAGHLVLSNHAVRCYRVALAVVRPNGIVNLQELADELGISKSYVAGFSVPELVRAGLMIAHRVERPGGRPYRHFTLAPVKVEVM